MTEKKNRRRVRSNAATVTESTSTLTQLRPDGVSADVWNAYGPMYPGSGLRWQKRMAELKGTPLDPFRECPAPGPVIDLTNYSHNRQVLRRRAAELYARVFGCPPPEVAA